MKSSAVLQRARAAIKSFHEDEVGEGNALTTVIMVLVAAIIVIGLIAFWGKLKTALDGFIQWLTGGVDNRPNIP